MTLPLQFDARNDVTLALALLGVAALVWAARSPEALRLAAAWVAWLGAGIVAAWWGPPGTEPLWAILGVLGGFLAGRWRAAWFGLALGVVGVAVATEVSWATAARRWEAYRAGIPAIDVALVGGVPPGLARISGARCVRDTRPVYGDTSGADAGFGVVGSLWDAGDPVYARALVCPERPIDLVVVEGPADARVLRLITPGDLDREISRASWLFRGALGGAAALAALAFVARDRTGREER